MKRLLALLLAVIMLLALVACGDADTDNDDEENSSKKSKGEVYTLREVDGDDVEEYKLTIKKGNKFELTYKQSFTPDEDDLGMFGIEEEKNVKAIGEYYAEGTYVENEDGTLTLTATSGKQKGYLEGPDAEEVKTAILAVYKQYFDGGWMSEDDYNEAIKQFDGSWTELDAEDMDEDITVKLDKENKTFTMPDYDDDDDYDYDYGDDE